MKLSEAIRLGALWRPQSHGSLYGERPRGILGLTTQRETSCALGAAFEAIGAAPEIQIAQKGDVLGGMRGSIHIAEGGETITLYGVPWYSFMNSVRSCPDCTKFDAVELHRLIPHLNDDHRWTREDIADLVETFEQACGESQSVGAVDPVVST